MEPKPTKATGGLRILRPTPRSTTDTELPFTSVRDTSSAPEAPENLCSSKTGAYNGPISSVVLLVRFIPRSDDVDVVVITRRPGPVWVIV
jgi:pyocin large subunit-like protein